ncbi:cell division protein PerM, partial [Corynebacterium xerosis]
TARAARIRRFLLAAAGVHGVALLLIISIAVIGVTVVGGGFTPLPATIASSWMLLNLGPFEFGGTDLGLVPALPAMAYFLAVAWRVRKEVSGPVSIRDVRTMAAVFLGAPLVLTLVAWLMLWDASGVLRIDAPFLPAALGSTAAIHAGALLAGMGPRLTRALLRRRSWPEWPLASLRLAAEYVGWLWAAGAVATIASMAWHHESVRETFSIAGGGGGVAGLLLLSIGYLPNIAFAAAGILVGAPANVGVAEAGLFAVTPGTLPPLPTLAAMPQSHLSPAFGVLLAVPVAIAVWRVHRHLRKSASDRPYVEVVVAAVIAGLLVALLAALMGGEVGQYGWSGVDWWLAGVLASVWLVVPGAIVAVMLGGVPRGAVFGGESGEAEGEPVDEPADEPADAEGPAGPEVAESTEGAETPEGEVAEEKTADGEDAEETVGTEDADGADEAAVADDDSVENVGTENEEEADREETGREETNGEEKDRDSADSADGDSAGDVVKQEPDDAPDAGPRA